MADAAGAEMADYAEPAGEANGSADYFYDTLAPYGTWVDVAGYGPCWQPTVVVVQSRLAAVLPWRAVGLQRLRLVLAVGLFLGLGAVPLRSLVLSQSLWLVLDAGQRVGSVLGLLEI